mmetsp:Transcript_52938/g.105198  ORF Transcript_52938/g.105198 Transcript_52938/m.105198 type:complete len:206 (+) Transcript_52938:868-1485(+)
MPQRGQAVHCRHSDARVDDIQPTADSSRVLGCRQRRARRCGLRDALRRDCQRQLPTRCSGDHGTHVHRGRVDDRHERSLWLRRDLQADEIRKGGRPCTQPDRVGGLLRRQDRLRHRRQGHHRALRVRRDGAFAVQIPPDSDHPLRLPRRPGGTAGRGIHAERLLRLHYCSPRPGCARARWFRGGQEEGPLRQRRCGRLRAHHAQS